MNGIFGAGELSLWRNVPATLFVRDELPSESEYANLPFPVFLKADRCHARGSGGRRYSADSDRCRGPSADRGAARGLRPRAGAGLRPGEPSRASTSCCGMGR